MPSKKFIELQEFTDENLKQELVETYSQQRKLKLDHNIRGLENPLVLKEVRKDIARLNTEIRRREVEAMTPEQTAERSKIRNRRKSNR